MRYLVPCSCGQTVPAGAGQAGQAVRCACGKSVSVPLLRELRELPVAPEETKSSPERRWGLAPILLFLGIIFGILGLSGAGVLAIGRARLDIGWSQQLQTEFDSRIIDTFTPEEAYSAWVVMRVEGIGKQEPTPEMLDQAAATMLGGYIRVLLAIGFGGLLLAVTAAYAGRRSGPTRRFEQANLQ